MTDLLDTPKTILMTVNAMWPGNDASGPNVSIAGLAEALSGKHRVLVMARDRAFGEPAAREKHNQWIDRGSASFRYFPIGKVLTHGLRKALNETPFDLIWLSSFFDREFTIPVLLMTKARLIERRPIILSPRGEFAKGALSLKPIRKSVYLKVAQHSGLLKGVRFHATSEQEKRDILTVAPACGDVAVAPNVRSLPHIGPREPRAPGAPVRLIFVGRITAVKNLDFALKVLLRVNVPVSLRIFGPAQDNTYWALCKAICATLPSHIKVQHEGEQPNDAIISALGEADMLFLPTLGENFGHAIFEALACGVPVLISNRTIWRDLEARSAGWDIPLENAEDKFARAIEAHYRMSASDQARLSSGARRIAEAYVEHEGSIGATFKLLEEEFRRAAK